MDLMKEDYQLFDRDNYAFKQLKEIHTPDEVELIKQEYKAHWQNGKRSSSRQLHFCLIHMA